MGPRGKQLIQKGFYEVFRESPLIAFVCLFQK